MVHGAGGWEIAHFRRQQEKAHHQAPKTVYLTFDDGPVAGTDDVIAVLKNRQVRGTLFMVGDHVKPGNRMTWLADAKASQYIEVANHSSTHAHLKYTKYYDNPATVLKGFKQANQTLGIRGNPYVVARLPGRNTWRFQNIVSESSWWNVIGAQGDSGAAADLLARNGFRIFGWDLEWHRHESGPKKGSPVETPQEMLNSVKSKLPFGTMAINEIVILAHDAMFRSSKGDRVKLEQFIDLLKAEGYQMDFLSNYRGLTSVMGGP